MLNGTIVRRRKQNYLFDDVDDYFKLVDEFLSKAFNNKNSIFIEKRSSSSKFPFYNCYVEFEDESKNIPKNLVFEFAVAGFSKDELNVEIIDETLIVKGEKEDKKNKNNIVVYVNGITERSFEIRFKNILNSKFNTENTKVKLENGILKIIIPFKEDNVKRKILEIE